MPKQPLCCNSKSGHCAWGYSLILSRSFAPCIAKASYHKTHALVFNCHEYTGITNIIWGSVILIYIYRVTWQEYINNTPLFLKYVHGLELFFKCTCINVRRRRNRGWGIASPALTFLGIDRHNIHEGIQIGGRIL